MKNTEERGGNFVFCFLVKESFFFFLDTEGFK